MRGCRWMACAPSYFTDLHPHCALPQVSTIQIFLSYRRQLRADFSPHNSEYFAGNVWYDYPAVNKVGCYTRQTIHHFRLKDRYLEHPNEQLYDWKHFDTTMGVCLRLTEYGFSQVPIQDKYSREVPEQKNFVYRLLGY